MYLIKKTASRPQTVLTQKLFLEASLSEKRTHIQDAFPGIRVLEAFLNRASWKFELLSKN
jgi:hypothetical protein